MCEYIKEFTCFADLTKQANEMLAKSDKVVEPSKLYSSLTETKFLDASQRNSVYRIFTDKKHFELAEQYVKRLNELDSVYFYKLVRNDITHIIYEKGGFFKRHEDYLSLTTNCLEEYTMIIYLNSDCIGGETVFHLNKFLSHASVPEEGKVVIFRKDLEHEGNLVTSGRKEILTANLWAIPRQNSNIVVVTFEEDKRFYCIPTANIMAFDNMINRCITFKGQQNDKLVYFCARETTYEGFRPVYDVFQRCYVSQYYPDVFDYYAIPKNRILISESSKAIECEFNLADEIIICASEAECTVFQERFPENILNFRYYLQKVRIYIRRMGRMRMKMRMKMRMIQ